MILKLALAALPLALKIIGLIISKGEKNAELDAAFLKLAKWASDSNYISKSLHDSFAAQASRNDAEIAKIKKERAEQAATQSGASK